MWKCPNGCQVDHFIVGQACLSLLSPGIEHALKVDVQGEPTEWDDGIPVQSDDVIEFVREHLGGCSPTCPQCHTEAQYAHEEVAHEPH